MALFEILPQGVITLSLKKTKAGIVLGVFDLNDLGSGAIKGATLILVQGLISVVVSSCGKHFMIFGSY